MTELSPRARRLLDLTRHEDDPDALAQSRVERALAARVTAGAAAAQWASIAFWLAVLAPRTASAANCGSGPLPAFRPP